MILAVLISFALAQDEPSIPVAPVPRAATPLTPSKPPLSAAVKPAAVKAPSTPVKAPPTAEATAKQNATDMIRYLNGEFRDPQRFQNVATYDSAPPECREDYENFMLKDPINISMTLGYTDIPGLNEVQDGPRAAAVIDQLLRECPRDKKVGACGFKPDPTQDDPTLFTKTFEWPEGQPHTVRLHLAKSSYSSDGAKNLGEFAAKQRDQSALAQKTLNDGLDNADVVIYAGHGRFGKGPSTVPRQQSTPTIADVERRLGARKSPAAFVGVFACNADRHWKADLRAKIGSKTQLALATGDTDVRVVYEQAYAYLDSILAMRCQHEFDRAMHVMADQPGLDSQPVDLSGQFFTPESVTEARVSSSDGSPSTLTRATQIHPAGDVKVQAPPKKSESLK